MGVNTVFGLVTGLVDSVMLAVLGVPLALLWGLLVFITNYIPYIGFWIGLVPPVLLALLTGGWELAAVVFALYTVVNFVLTSVIQPKYVGDAVGISVSLTLRRAGLLGLGARHDRRGARGAADAVREGAARRRRSSGSVGRRDPRLDHHGPPQHGGAGRGTAGANQTTHHRPRTGRTGLRHPARRRPGDDEHVPTRALT